MVHVDHAGFDTITVVGSRRTDDEVREPVAIDVARAVHAPAGAGRLGVELDARAEDVVGPAGDDPDRAGAGAAGGAVGERRDLDHLDVAVTVDVARARDDEVLRRRRDLEERERVVLQPDHRADEATGDDLVATITIDVTNDGPLELVGEARERDGERGSRVPEEQGQGLRVAADQDGQLRAPVGVEVAGGAEHLAEALVVAADDSAIGRRSVRAALHELEVACIEKLPFLALRAPSQASSKPSPSWSPPATTRAPSTSPATPSNGQPDSRAGPAPPK